MVEQLLLATENVHKVQIHPLVVFQILDRFLRRNEGQESVIGTLLGTVANDGVVEVSNSYAVPHLEKGDEVAVGTEFHKQMQNLHAKVNSKETVVGWYATSSSSNGSRELLITEQSCLIHDFYGSECESPVHLVLDTSIKQHSGSVQIKAFISSALALVDSALSNQFKQIQVETKVMEAESIALDIMTQNRRSGWATDSTGLSELAPDLEALQKSIERLQAMIEAAAEYVHKVTSNQLTADKAIGRSIANALMAVPEVSSEKFDKIFNNSLQDLLMINYLSTLTQAQLSLSEKLLNASHH